MRGLVFVVVCVCVVAHPLVAPSSLLGVTLNQIQVGGSGNLISIDLSSGTVSTLSNWSSYGTPNGGHSLRRVGEGFVVVFFDSSAGDMVVRSMSALGKPTSSFVSNLFATQLEPVNGSFWTIAHCGPSPNVTTCLSKVDLNNRPHIMPFAQLPSMPSMDWDSTCASSDAFYAIYSVENDPFGNIYYPTRTDLVTGNTTVGAKFPSTASCPRSWEWFNGSLYALVEGVFTLEVVRMDASTLQILETIVHLKRNLDTLGSSAIDVVSGNMYFGTINFSTSTSVSIAIVNIPSRTVSYVPISGDMIAALVV